MARSLFIGLGVLAGVALYFDGLVAASTAMHQVFYILRALFWMLAFSLVGCLFRVDGKPKGGKAGADAPAYQGQDLEGSLQSSDKAIERLRKERAKQ